MKPFCRWLVVVGLILAGLSRAVASPGAETVEVVFRVFALRAPAEVYYRPRPDAPLDRVPFQAVERSAALRYRGGRTLTFYADPAGTVPVAEVVFEPGGPRQYLFIFVPLTGGTQGGWEVLAVPDDVTRVPPGTLQVINTTLNPYEVAAAGARLNLGPRAAVTLRHTHDVVTLWLNRRGQWRRVGWIPLELDPETRGWLLVFTAHRPTELQPQLRLLAEGAP